MSFVNAYERYESVLDERVESLLPELTLSQVLGGYIQMNGRLVPFFFSERTEPIPESSRIPVLMLVNMVCFHIVLQLLSLVNLICAETYEWDKDECDTAAQKGTNKKDQCLSICCTTNQLQVGVILKGKMVDGLNLE